MEENYELTNNMDDSQYEFHVGKYLPKIEYIISNNGEIYLTHTEVPTALEGKGIGSQLVEKVLIDIEEKGLRLVHYARSLPDTLKSILSGKEL